MRTLKGLLIEGLETSGLNALLRPRYSGLGVIFLLHRVLEPGTRTTVPGNAVTTEQLDATLRYVRHAGWDILALADAIERLRSGPPGDPFACFTFDDGFRDNLTLGLPIFRVHGARFTVFLTTGFVGHRTYAGNGSVARLLPVGYLLAEYVALHPELQGERRRLGLRDGTASETYYDLLRLERENGERFDEIIAQLLAPLSQDAHDVLDGLFLDWTAARELAADPLVGIGAHSVTHPRLALLPPQDCQREMVESRATICRELGTNAAYFAYPYGGAAECAGREFAMAGAVGYDASLTTRPGNIFPEHRDHLHALPRVVLSMVPHAATTRFVKAALFGSRNAILNRFSRFARD